MDGMTVEGGCFCGAVRYRVEGSPAEADFCHCRMCQRAAGAPFVAWGTWPQERFAWTLGKPGVFASSPRGKRSFCRACGTNLAFVDPTEPGQVDVTLASLDEPARFAPTRHAWTASRVPWLEIGDALPRHVGSART